MFYKENQMMKCSACYGRGLNALKDGSDSMQSRIPPGEDQDT